MCRTCIVPSLSPSRADEREARVREPAILSGPVSMGKFTGASRNAISGPVKFPVNRPGKLSGPVVTGSFEKRAPGVGL